MKHYYDMKIQIFANVKFVCPPTRGIRAMRFYPCPFWSYARSVYFMYIFFHLFKAFKRYLQLNSGIIICVCVCNNKKFTSETHDFDLDSSKCYPKWISGVQFSFKLKCDLITYLYIDK